ncbi:hypothetical protein AE1304_05720 [Aeromonas enteropelogenes]
MAMSREQEEHGSILSRILQSSGMLMASGEACWAVREPKAQGLGARSQSGKAFAAYVARSGKASGEMDGALTQSHSQSGT